MSKLIIGCGYLGRRVAARWLAQGHVVYGMTRSKEAELRGLGIQPLVGDVRETFDLFDAPQCETVLYAVAPGRQQEQTPAEVWMKGLANLSSCLERSEPRPRLIFISSTSVYGQIDGEWVTEDSPTEPIEEAGKVLVQAERALLKGWWPDAIILRFAGIYGFGRLLRAQSIASGEPIVGDPNKWLNLIHVEDGATAILDAEARASPGAIYNVSDGCPVRRREFYARMAEAIGAPAPQFVLPDPNAPLPPHETGNRRVSNRRMREQLAVELRYPSYDAGLTAAVRGADSLKSPARPCE
jgi:nucleoside-diphosphate-sugar epimerase